jgi:hypothetical protein
MDLTEITIDTARIKTKEIFDIINNLCIDDREKNGLFLDILQLMIMRALIGATSLNNLEELTIDFGNILVNSIKNYIKDHRMH